MARWKLSPTLTISRANREIAYLAVSSFSRSERLRMFSTSACALSSRSLRSTASAWSAAITSWGVRCPVLLWEGVLPDAPGTPSPGVHGLSADWSCGLSPIRRPAILAAVRRIAHAWKITGHHWPAATLRSCPISGSGRKKSSEQASNEFGGKVHHRDDAGVVEAGRSDNAKDAHHLALRVLKWGDDEGRSRQ